MNTSLDEDTK